MQENKQQEVNEEADALKFTLDPEESEMFVGENDDENRNDIQEAKTEDNDNDNDNDRYDNDNARYDDNDNARYDGKDNDDQYRDGWFENDNQG